MPGAATPAPSGLYAAKAEVPDAEIVDELGVAKVLREGEDATILALPAADALEDLAIPSVERIVETIGTSMQQ